MSAIQKIKLLAQLKRNPENAMLIYCDTLGKSLQDELGKAAGQLRKEKDNPEKVMEVAFALEDFAKKSAATISENLPMVHLGVISELKRRNKQ